MVSTMDYKNFSANLFLREAPEKVQRRLYKKLHDKFATFSVYSRSFCCDPGQNDEYSASFVKTISGGIEKVYDFIFEEMAEVYYCNSIRNRLDFPDCDCDDLEECQCINRCQERYKNSNIQGKLDILEGFHDVDDEGIRGCVFEVYHCGSSFEGKKWSNHHPDYEGYYVMKE